MFEYVLTDRAYVERLERHYRMFKAGGEDERGLRVQRKRSKKPKLRVVQ